MAQWNEQMAKHDLYVHVQYQHGAMPPYQGLIQEVHAWLHDDATDECDRDHGVTDVTLPPRREYPRSSAR